MILAIDPGPKESAFLTLWHGNPYEFEKVPSADLLNDIRDGRFGQCDHLAIEMVESFGMAVGKEVFETVFYSGRFVEAWFGNPWMPVYRKDVKMHFCHSMRAKDANIRQALIDRFGGSAAIGRKKEPGPLHGIAGDCWSALAIACWFFDTQAIGAAT